MTPAACGDKFDEWSRMIPISKTDARSTGHAAKINDQTEKDQEDLSLLSEKFNATQRGTAYNEHNFEQSKPEFDLAIDPDE